MNEPRKLSRVTRTLMQQIAGGALAGLIAAVSDAVGDEPVLVAAIAVVAGFVVAYAQNWLEDHGHIADRRI